MTEKSPRAIEAQLQIQWIMGPPIYPYLYHYNPPSPLI